MILLGSLLSASLLGGVWIWLEAEQIYQYTDTVDGLTLPPVDAIVCLAGGRGRIAACGDLWVRYAQQKENPDQIPVLYFSGMGSRANWNTVKSLVRPGVLQALTPDQVVVETESSNTVSNALWLSRYARERGWKKILLMTSRYHMKRAMIIFSHYLSGKEGRSEIGMETLSVYQEPFEPGEWREDSQGIRVTVLEYLKLVYYRDFWLPRASPEEGPWISTRS